MREERLYRCGGCAKTEPWSSSWRWPHVPLDRGYYDGRVGHPACSARCEVKILAGELA